MGGNDPTQAPPPSAPPPTIGQPPVAGSSNLGVDARVVIDNRQRGSLSAGYGAYAGQGYSQSMVNLAAHFREIADCRPDIITQSAERFDQGANRGAAFLQEGQFVAQYNMVNGRYALAKVYDMNDPRPNGDRYLLDQTRARLATQQQNIDPYTAAGIGARRSFENLALNDPGYLANHAHVYPNANGFRNGDAYLVMDVGGRPYGAKYGFVDGRFEMKQVFDLQDRIEGPGFSQQEYASQNREMNFDRSAQRVGGPYGAIPVPYPVGRGGSEVGVHVGDRRAGTDVGVVIETDRRGGVHGGGRVDVPLPGGGRIDVGIFKR